MATDNLLDVGGERGWQRRRVHRDVDSNNLHEQLVSHEEKRRLIIQASFLHCPFGISVWQLGNQTGAGLDLRCLWFEDASSEQMQ